MSESSDGLWLVLSALADSYADAGRELLSAARKLHMPGLLPSQALIGDLERLRDAHAALRDRCLGLASELGVEAPGAGSLEGLKDLAKLLEILAVAEEERDERAALVASALALLDRVMGLRHVQDEAFAPLAACREQAGVLREGILGKTVEATDDVVKGLAENDHPFAYLMTLVDGVEVVSDDLWESLFASVGRAFGRPLAAAVARAKIVAIDAPAPAAIAPEVEEPRADEVHVAAPVETPDETEPEGPAVEVDVVFAPVGATPSVPFGGPVWGIDQAMSTLNTDELLDSVVEEATPFFPQSLSGALAARRAARPARRKSSPKVERLETVRLLSCNVISGYVFLDANNDGLYQPATEAPIVGNAIELHNAVGVVVGTATTDAQGFYSFSTDGTISTAPRTVDQSVTIPSQLTNFTNPYTLAKFDPTLGELIGVDITVTGTLTSDVRSENLSTSSPDTIIGTVSGSISLTGPGINVSGTISSAAGTFDASIYDGAIDHAGTSGVDFGPKTAPINQSVSLVKGTDDLAPFIGPGTIAGTFEAKANSGATGGGNIDVFSVSSATATIRVVYRYTPSNCLTPGNYSIVQPQEPPGTLDGKESSNGTVLPPKTSGPDTIPVTLGDTDLINNDFGELKPASLSGHVYWDANNNGVLNPGESGIAGATVTLRGTDDLGHAVKQTVQTDAAGVYGFGNLRPGSYEVLETQPTGYLDGKDAVGSQGGTLSNDRITSITLGQGTAGVNNDFGELKPASLAGNVYYDKNDDGVKDAGETGIAGATLALTGTDDTGAAVSLSAQSDAAGAYSFGNLRPGNYEILETQPAGYIDGKDTVGSQGGLASNDRFYGINLGQDVHGVDNNFGELKVAGLSGYVYHDRNDDGVKEAGEPGIAGTTVTLEGTDTNGAVVNLSTLTDASGAYSFLNLLPGSYEIIESQPAGYLDGKDAIGSQGGLSSNDRFYGINLPPDTSGTNNNFGELKPASLAGYVYYDRNDNGVKDAADVGIANTTVTLKGTDDTGAAVNLSAQTDASGAYAFTKLRPGTYAITESQPPGYLQGTNTIGSQGGTVGTDQFSAINLGQEVNGVNNNFGEVLPAEINGYVYIDESRNGLKGPGDAGIPNVAIELTGTDDQGNPVVRNTTTDASGFYDFKDLRPGTYSVTEVTQPIGYDDGQETRGNVTPLTGTVGTDSIPGITVAPGGIAPNNNFGEYRPGTPQGPDCTTIARLEDVERLGIHHQPTRFVLTFNTALDPVSASNVKNYHLVYAYRNGTFGKTEIPIRSASYNATNYTVTLTPAYNLNIHRHYRLTVSGLLDSCGDPFDGNRDGLPGGNSLTIITKADYHGALPAGPGAHATKAATWAHKYPRLAAEHLSASASTAAARPRLRRS